MGNSVVNACIALGLKLRSIDLPLSNKGHVVGGHIKSIPALIDFFAIFPASERVASPRRLRALNGNPLAFLIFIIVDRNCAARIPVSVIRHVIRIRRNILCVESSCPIDRIGEAGFYRAFAVSAPTIKIISTAVIGLGILVRLLGASLRTQVNDILLGNGEFRISGLHNHILSTRALRSVDGYIHINVPARLAARNIGPVLVGGAACIRLFMIGPRNRYIVWTGKVVIVLILLKDTIFNRIFARGSHHDARVPYGSPRHPSTIFITSSVVFALDKIGHINGARTHIEEGLVSRVIRIRIGFYAIEVCGLNIHVIDNGDLRRCRQTIRRCVYRGCTSLHTVNHTILVNGCHCFIFT